MDNIISKENIKLFLKYGIVGAIGTLINLLILFSLTELVGLYYIISEILAYTIVLVNNFIMNKMFTFQEEFRENFLKKFSQYSVISIAALILNLIILFWLVEYLFIWYIFAEIIAMICSFLLNFIGNRFWTFKEKNE